MRSLKQRSTVAKEATSTMNTGAGVAARAQKALAILLSLLAGGCMASGEKDPTAGAAQASFLADTRWRLVEIQSMDDAIGTKRPADPSLYTMQLNSNGTVALHLNCNSAHGIWSANPGKDPISGQFEFGPLAATRAFCPPPSLDEQIATQARYIRSYLLKDGRLYLSLMADGGIYAWEPHTDQAFQRDPEPGLEAAILQASPYYTRAIVGQEEGGDEGRYIYGRVDLNGDGRDEVFVYLLGSFFCGTGGCNLLLFADGPQGYSLLNNFPIRRLPIIVSSVKTAGWNDLWQLQSGGGAAASYVRLSFDGKQYVERERVPADKIPEGQRHLTGEFTFDKGIPLKPRN